MSTETTAITGKINKIALSLSGGGVRAVGFHLGTMSMLDRLDLLTKVEIISTVSGGSLPGLGYALSQRFGRSFQNFFDDFYEFLPQLNVIEELLSRVTAKAPVSPSGRRDMIASLANIYHTKYFKQFFSDYSENDRLTFDMLLRQPHKGHLKEMIFNATEFKSGSAFRFQVSEFRCLIGNGHVSLCMKHALQIRLADIMAASSCIPMGMEPLFFPDDFHWPDDKRDTRSNKVVDRPTCNEIRAALRRNTDTAQPNIALMDGGIYDNQGITSTLLALNRRKTRKFEKDDIKCGQTMENRGDPTTPQEFANWMSGKVVQGASYQTVTVSSSDLDLLIISDTPVRKRSIFPRIAFAQKDDTSPSGRIAKTRRSLKNWAIAWLESRTLGWLDVLGKVMLVIVFASIGMNLWALNEGDWWQADRGWFYNLEHVVFQIITPLLVLPAVFILLALLKLNRTKAERAMQKMIPDWKGNPKQYMNKLKVGDLLTMAMLRFGSVSALTSTIFMNRIRALGYATAYSRPDLQNRVQSNEIFTLQDAPFEQDTLHVELKQRKAWPPPQQMMDIVDIGASMATKLWIDPAKEDSLNDLDYLVITGQCTMCYNLMRYLWDSCRRNDEFLLPETAELFEKAVTEWKKLVARPDSLLRDRKSKSRLKQLNEEAAA